ncbi:hypothetical protein SAMN05444401_3331 [Clostridium amylolyticum]|uniref:Uncharacterized protein n=1 Tax=Clostridium amylolyticum TaxID=1121298 RepID=A0A1M6KEA9_9CLOT|nr:hypothetical protein [Clostridium amylolyticum]SHJ57294.1 hypothetical protein SAMN05444401_3331 [Clostridium amylolyticum]
MNIESLPERIPIEETIRAIEYVKYERNIEKLKSYVDDIMPFGEKTTVKYRNKFIQRFIEVTGEEIIYSPLLRFINEIDNFQTKKDIIYFIVCSTSSAVGEIVKAFNDKKIPEIVDSEELLEAFTKSMKDAKESSIKKTYSVSTTILTDFNILSSKKDEDTKNKKYILNTNLRPNNEAILFNLYYEFIKIKGNKMPEEEAVLDCDTFKYFLMSNLMKKRYLKWIMDKGYIEHYVMGGNSKYQFAYDTLDLLVEKVISND